jgi:hypothetical protein
MYPASVKLRVPCLAVQRTKRTCRAGPQDRGQSNKDSVWIALPAEGCAVCAFALYRMAGSFDPYGACHGTCIRKPATSSGMEAL